MAVGNEPCTYVLIRDRANRDSSTIPIRVPLIAEDGLPPDEVGQSKRSFLATATTLTIGTAHLIGFWRIDTEQANTPSMNLNRVAINYRGGSSQPVMLGAK